MFMKREQIDHTSTQHGRDQAEKQEGVQKNWSAQPTHNQQTAQENKAQQPHLAPSFESVLSSAAASATPTKHNCLIRHTVWVFRPCSFSFLFFSAPSLPLSC